MEIFLPRSHNSNFLFCYLRHIRHYPSDLRAADSAVGLYHIVLTYGVLLRSIFPAGIVYSARHFLFPGGHFGRGKTWNSHVSTLCGARFQRSQLFQLSRCRPCHACHAYWMSRKLHEGWFDGCRDRSFLPVTYAITTGQRTILRLCRGFSRYHYVPQPYPAPNPYHRLSTMSMTIIL